MQSDPRWNVDLMNGRVAFDTKIADTIDNEDQIFVKSRSVPPDTHLAGIARPLLTARTTMYLQIMLRALPQREY
jgi:hypothetical protein